MEVMDAIRQRESFRSFKNEQISDEELKKLIYAAERAPRIGSIELIVLQNKEKIAAISDATKDEMLANGGWNRMRAQTPDYNPLYRAPTVIMFVGYKGEPFISETAFPLTGRNTFSAISTAFSPDILITEMPPSAKGVAIAAIVFILFSSDMLCGLLPAVISARFSSL